MILPAIHYRLIGFVTIDNGKVKMLPEGEHSNTMLVTMPNGKKEVLKLIGNKKNITAKEVKKYFENKEKLLIKGSTIKAVKNYMLTSRKYKKIIDEYEKKLIENGTTDEDKLDRLINEFVDDEAKKYVSELKRIKKDFILKSPISRTKNGELISRAIIFEDDHKPSKSGLYVVSSSYDTWPIEILPVKNKQGEFSGFFKVQTNNLMSVGHWNSLLEHYKRTINMFEKEKKEVISLNFRYNYESLKKILDSKQMEFLKNLFKEFRELTENNKIPLKNKENYLKKIEILKKIINKESILAANIYAEIMIVDYNFPKKNYEGKTLLSQLKKQAEIFVNLNYAKESLEKREEVLNKLLKKIEDFKLGKSGIVLATYNAANEPIGEKKSWGFMDNNIQINHAMLKPTKY